ncbi:hypothetical protein ABK040_016593 [Willaertia magna]
MKNHLLSCFVLATFFFQSLYAQFFTTTSSDSTTLNTAIQNNATLKKLYFPSEYIFDNKLEESNNVPIGKTKKYLSPLFLAHGAPTIAIQTNHPFHLFLREIGKKALKQKPRAIIVFSGHYEDENQVSVTYTNNVYETVYDFHGFPKVMYELKYPAKGSTKIADEVIQLLSEAEIKTKKDTFTGLDHGTWTLLYSMFYKEHNDIPKEALDIPVIQCSVNPFGSVEQHIKIGKALRSLTKLSEDENLNKEEGNVLIIGSGATVHNFGKLSWSKFGKTDIEFADPFAIEFDNWLIENLMKQDERNLNNYLKVAPYARDAVPRAEHFLPIFIPFGASIPSSSFDKSEIISQQPEDKVKLLSRVYDGGSLSYLGIEFN